QVTNPPLDAIREEVVTSLGGVIGPEGDLLHPTAESCHQILLPQPVLHNDELDKLIHLDPADTVNGRAHGFSSRVIRCLYPVAEGGAGLRTALESVRAEVSVAIAGGAQVIILSDRESDDLMAPIPSLLAVAAVHHHLVRERSRTKVGLVVEAGDAREVHHVAALVGFGAAAVNPYMAFESIEDLIDRGVITGVDRDKAIRNYIKAAGKGVL
ncbi:glutamate synthase subunit alpha, partial [Staphylococcus capitis]|nr:glutamate synthase subunit alpha [Staphylococcus capitis]